MLIFNDPVRTILTAIPFKRMYLLSLGQVSTVNIFWLKFHSVHP